MSPHSLLQSSCCLMPNLMSLWRMLSTIYFPKCHSVCLRWSVMGLLLEWACSRVRIKQISLCKCPVSLSLFKNKDFTPFFFKWSLCLYTFPFAGSINLALAQPFHHLIFFPPFYSAESEQWWTVFIRKKIIFRSVVEVEKARISVTEKLLNALKKCVHSKA